MAERSELLPWLGWPWDWRKWWVPRSGAKGRVETVLVAQDPRRHIHPDVATFLDEQELGTSVFLKYPDVYNLYRYIEESIEVSGKSSLIITPDTSSNINLKEADWHSTWEGDETDNKSFYGRVGIDSNTIVAITYSELRAFEKLPEEIKQSFLRNISTVYALDISWVAKKELSILSQMQSLTDSTPFIFHSTWIDFVSNRNLWDIYSWSQKQEKSLTIDDLVTSGILTAPDFHTLKNKEDRSSNSQIVDQFIEISKLNKETTAIWYCESDEQLRSIWFLLDEHDIPYASVWNEEFYSHRHVFSEVWSWEKKIVLTVWNIWWNIDMSMFTGALFFYSPSNKQLSSQVLAAMQKSPTWWEPFIVDMESWPIRNTLSPTNVIHTIEVDQAKLFAGVEKWTSEEKGTLTQAAKVRQASSPSIRNRLSFLWEMSSWNKWDRRICAIDDPKLLEEALQGLNRQWYTNLAHVEKETVSQTLELINTIPELKEFLRRHIGSYTYVNQSNRRYIFESLIWLRFLKKEEYIKNCKQYLREHGIHDYATCIRNPVKKSRAKSSKKKSFREMNDSADLYYMYNLVGGKENLSEFDAEDRRKLAENLFQNEIWTTRAELCKRLKDDFGVENYVDLLYFRYRVPKNKWDTFAWLKKVILSQESFKDILVSLDIVPSQFSKEDIPKLGKCLGFDMSEETVSDQFGIQINKLLDIKDGDCSYICLDWMIYMWVSIFCEKVLQNNPALVLFAKHFMTDQDIKPSRITGEQKSRLTDLLSTKIQGKNKIYNIVNYKKILEEDFEKKELSFHNFNSAKEALERSRHLAIFLASQMDIWHIDDQDTFNEISRELAKRNIDL